MPISASLRIDFTVVGGGIGGLACAYALARSGHHVRVLEKASSSRRVCFSLTAFVLIHLLQTTGGIRVPPNLSKILVEWGLEHRLRNVRRCRTSTFMSADTGESVGSLEWKETVIRETGGEFLLMAHEELHRLMFDLALSAGANISFNTTVVSLSTHPSPSVTLADGSILRTDVIIGADGVQSIVRDFVNGVPDTPRDSYHSFFTFTVPSNQLRKIPELGKWVDLPQWPIWMGDSRSILAFPIRDGSEFCFQIYWPDAELVNPKQVKEGWEEEVSTDCLDLTGYYEPIRQLTRSVPTALRTRCLDRDRIEDWVDDTGCVVLIGEAAHPILPCSTNGASLAVEDAAVLGGLMSHLRTRKQIPQFLAAFQELRQDRSIEVKESEWRNALICTMPPGEMRDQRDAALKSSNENSDDDWDDNALRKQYDSIGSIFGYNATEAAEDWWRKWGILGDMIPPDLTTAHFTFSTVTKVEILRA